MIETHELETILPAKEWGQYNNIKNIQPDLQPGDLNKIKLKR